MLRMIVDGVMYVVRPSGRPCSAWRIALFPRPCGILPEPFRPCSGAARVWRHPLLPSIEEDGRSFRCDRFGPKPAAGSASFGAAHPFMPAGGPLFGSNRSLSGSPPPRLRPQFHTGLWLMGEDSRRAGRAWNPQFPGRHRRACAPHRRCASRTASGEAPVRILRRFLQEWTQSLVKRLLSRLQYHYTGFPVTCKVTWKVFRKF